MEPTACRVAGPQFGRLRLAFAALGLDLAVPWRAFGAFISLISRKSCNEQNVNTPSHKGSANAVAAPQ